jgi:hypothetical protein
MLLKGSCHCRAVRFSLRSETPYPYMWCYCSICRKTAGGGGYAINIMGRNATLKVSGEKDLSVYRAKRAGGKRYFCGKCGSALWVWDKRWPEWIYPFASAIDTKLPIPPKRERQLIFLGSRANWPRLPEGRRFSSYPKEAIIDWHRKRGLLSA